jgi:hypothetical protein
MDDQWTEVKLTVKREVVVTLPANAEAWQLYVGQAGAEEAARSLTNTLKETLQNTMDPDLASKQMLNALDAYHEVGAADTEPRWVATDAMRRVFGEDFEL